MGKGEWAALLVGLVAAVVVAMAAAAPRHPARRWVWGAGVTVILFAVLYLARSVVPVFIVGLFVAYLLDPLIDRLEKKGWRRSCAIALVFAGFFVVLLVAVFLLVPPIVSQLQAFGRNISSYQPKAEALIMSLVERAQRAGGDVPGTGLPQYMQEALDRLGETLTKGLANVLSRIIGWLLGSLGFAFSFILLPIVTYYFLRDFGPVKAKVKAAVPLEQRQKMVEAVRDVEAMVGRFLRGMFTVCIAVGVTVSLILWALSQFFHFQYSLLVGTFAGLTYAIPFIGAWATVALGTSIAFFTGDPAIYSALAAFVAIVGINQLFDNLVTPSVVGTTIGLHPLWVVFTLMVFGKLFGFAGMLFAWPVAGLIQIVVTHYLRLAGEQTQPEVAVEDQSST